MMTALSVGLKVVLYPYCLGCYALHFGSVAQTMTARQILKVLHNKIHSVIPSKSPEWNRLLQFLLSTLKMATLVQIPALNAIKSNMQHGTIHIIER
tara:strand:+ start:1763 stop:2050 length:288 start_codon:yes stop_codon:yes gene_type:complete